jgi:23S rRNA G2069 N7-methylase RlmK/C1962 C5-methylase RlmI
VRVLAQAAPAAQAAPVARVVASDAGLVLNSIKLDKMADFEAVVGKLKEALQKSGKPQRKAQAAAWRVYRAVEPGANGAILYVFEIDPAVHGADYTVSTILAEGFPGEVQDLYKRYAEAYASGQNVVNLTLVAALGQ